jgi:hypothetical protein
VGVDVEVKVKVDDPSYAPDLSVYSSLSAAPRRSWDLTAAGAIVLAGGVVFFVGTGARSAVTSPPGRLYLANGPDMVTAEGDARNVHVR